MRTLLVVILFPITLFAGDYSPDPLAVRRHGPAYKYPQAGWIVLHIEGKPYDRGVQHGTLMATEIAAYVRCFAADQGPKDPSAAWANARRLTKALFLRKFDPEYLEEMQGIADGAAEAGAKFDGRPIDLTDIVALNCWPEIDTLDGGLDALPTGLEGRKLPTPKAKEMPAAKAEHCSAFAAVGPATADGKIVFGHITMFGLYPARFYNVWLDVKPEKGERVLMQAFPGGIQSGMDYYLNSAGLIVCETTIAQTRFDVNGIPLTNRIRKALQYGKSIDDVVKILSDGNNGLYSNEWLLADTKTNEIAMFELGTKSTKLWRSSKDEWFGGTPGFYWGCNNTKDLQVRLETISDLRERPRSTAWVPSARDKKWLQFYAENRGKIDGEAGKRAFSTPPICAASSLDAKVTTTAMMKDLKTHAIFGPPIGGTWQPTDHEREEFTEIVPLVPNDWTVLHPNAPAKPQAAKAVDLPAKAQGFMSFNDRQPPGIPNTKPAWHGTLLLKSDADLWLTEGFAAYEKIVAMEQALRAEHDDGKLNEEDHERLAIEFNLHRIRILPPTPEEPEAQAKGVPPERSHFVRSETGRGVMRLREVRRALGEERFVELMDEFGLAHAGKEVTGEQFIAFVDQHKRKTDNIDSHVDQSLEVFQVPRFTVKSWSEEQERTVIVYGTTADVEANRETAELLQKTVARRGTNIVIPILSDTQAGTSPDKVTGKHVLLIGGPTTNKLADRWRELFPVKFGSGSFELRKDVYAHPGSAIIAAGHNPLDHVSSVVVIAGLSAESTRFATRFLLEGDLRAGNVLLLPNLAKGRSLVVK
jgi:hypothetical protein